LLLPESATTCAKIQVHIINTALHGNAGCCRLRDVAITKPVLFVPTKQEILHCNAKYHHWNRFLAWPSTLLPSHHNYLWIIIFGMPCTSLFTQQQYLYCIQNQTAKPKNLEQCTDKTNTTGCNTKGTKHNVRGKIVANIAARCSSGFK
jgi:hypothetical protein